MQGKISMEIHLPGIAEEKLKPLTEKVLQVASNVLLNLEKIKYEGIVEIIKATLQYSSPLGTPSKGRPITVDFKVDFHPISWGHFGEAFREKFQVVARWEIGAKNVAFYKERAVPGEGNYLDGVSLRDEEITTLTSVVVQAMRAIIQKKASFHSEIADKLLRADGQLFDIAEPLFVAKK